MNMITQIALPSGYEWSFEFRDISANHANQNNQYANLAISDTSLQRETQLIQEAIARYEKTDACRKRHGNNFVGYRLYGTAYGDPLDSFYCFNVHADERLCIVSTSERGRSIPISMHPLSCRSAAIEYFVNLVTEGLIKIDWSINTEVLKETSLLGKLFGKK